MRPDQPSGPLSARRGYRQDQRPCLGGGMSAPAPVARFDVARGSRRNHPGPAGATDQVRLGGAKVGGALHSRSVRHLCRVRAWLRRQLVSRAGPCRCATTGLGRSSPISSLPLRIGDLDDFEAGPNSPAEPDETALPASQSSCPPRSRRAPSGTTFPAQDRHLLRSRRAGLRGRKARDTLPRATARERGPEWSGPPATRGYSPHTKMSRAVLACLTGRPVHDLSAVCSHELLAVRPRVAGRPLPALPTRPSAREMLARSHAGPGRCSRTRPRPRVYSTHGPPASTHGVPAPGLQSVRPVVSTMTAHLASAAA